MAKLKALRTDLELEQTGVEVEFGGIKFKVARASNPAAVELGKKLLRRWQMQHPGAKLSVEEGREITARVFAKHVLVGWSEMEDDSGNPVPYSEDKAFEILNDPEFKDVFEFIDQTAGRSELFRRQRIEEIAGN